MNRIAVVVCALLVGVCALSTADAAIFSGRAGVSSYLWENSEIDSSDTRHLQNTGTMSLRMARIAGQDLSISTSLRGRFDSRNQGDNVDDYRIYNLMIRWRDIANRIDLTGGRQHVSWPTGSVSLDGGAAEIRTIKGLSIGGYFGLTVPTDGSLRLNEYDDGHAFGVRLIRRCKPIGRLVIAFAERRSARSYTINGEMIELNNLASRRIALDWRRAFAGFGTAYGHLTYQMPTQRISRAHLSARWQASPTVSVHGQVRYRRPDLAYNSIFFVFGDTRYYEGRIRFNVRLNQNWTANFGGTYVDLVEDNTQRFDFGASHRYFSVMVHGKAGGSGSTLGLTGSALYPVNERWTIRGGARYASYELFEDQADANSEGSIWGGVRWNWTPQSSLELEAQMVTQDITTQTEFAGNESDFRLIARWSWRFFERLGE